MSKRRGMSRMTTMEVGVMGATSRAHRRMSVFCSHIRQVENGGASYSPVSQSYCQGSSEEEERASLTGSGKEKDCIFCRISSGESPSFKIYEDDVCMCILDSYPLIRGHSLLIPKSHFSSLGETSPAVIAAMFSKVPFLSKAIMKATQCDSFNLLVNNGVAAGQVVFHTHLHIIPRRRDDKLWTTKNNKFDRKSLKTKHDADALVHCIREHVSLPSKDGDSCETLE